MAKDRLNKFLDTNNYKAEIMLNTKLLKPSSSKAKLNSKTFKSTSQGLVFKKEKAKSKR